MDGRPSAKRMLGRKRSRVGHDASTWLQAVTGCSLQSPPFTASARLDALLAYYENETPGFEFQPREADRMPGQDSAGGLGRQPRCRVERPSS